MIETHWCVLLCTLAALLSLLVGFGGARVLDRFRINNAQLRVAELTQQANQKADSIVKEAELRAKDEVYQRREEFNREMEAGRNELRDQERRLDKKEDNLVKYIDAVVDREMFNLYIERKKKKMLAAGLVWLVLILLAQAVVWLTWPVVAFAFAMGVIVCVLADSVERLIGA